MRALQCRFRSPAPRVLRDRSRATAFVAWCASLFPPALINALRHSDYYMVTVDFDAYCATQRSVERLWLSTSDWTRASMLNIARMAWFSSDRTVGEYAQDIWKVPFELPSNREQEQTS